MSIPLEKCGLFGVSLHPIPEKEASLSGTECSVFSLFIGYPRIRCGAHTMLRMVLPKGTSFEFLTQWDVNLIVNHINSTPRESLGGKTPYQMALESFGEDALKALQLRPIAPDEVTLTPKLIRYNR